MRRMILAGQHAFFLALLLVAVWQAVHDGRRPGLSIAAGVILGAWYAIGAWRLGWVDVRRGSRAEVVWIVGLSAIWLIAMWVSPDFTWVVFVLFLLYLNLIPLPWSAIAVAALTVGVIGYRMMTHPDGYNPGGIIGPIIGALAVFGFWVSYRNLAVEAGRRQDLVHQLITTQDDLVATTDALAGAQRESGTLTERARLAREIHDTLAQGFSSILLLARAAQADPQTAGLVIKQIETTAADNLAEARRVVRALAPSELDISTLAEALRRIAERLGEQTGIDVRVTVDGAPVPLDVAREVALVRVAQSALANVRLHSKATTAAVTLQYAEDAVVLDVVDDGVGFAVERESRAGFGLRAMRERIRELGGTLAVESAPGEGTALSARLPLAVATAPPEEEDR